MWWTIVAALLLARAEGGRHAFYRSMGTAAGGGNGARRVFGGAAAQLSEFPAICALLDRYWAVRCSGTVLSSRWALTAAHCISPRLAYVKYNTRRPTTPGGDVAPIQYLYRHPGYEVRQADDGHGSDVTLLQHDVGLVRTRVDMRLALAPAAAPLASLRRHDAMRLDGEDVVVLGFGRTEQSALGEELFAVRLKMGACERDAWRPCACGLAAAEPRAVCSGDSGGPVLYRGLQVALTSMGPAQCARASPPPAGSTSVFTALQRYADLLNATVAGADAALRMKRISSGCTALAPPLHFAFLLYCFYNLTL